MGRPTKIKLYQRYGDLMPIARIGSTKRGKFIVPLFVCYCFNCGKDNHVTVSLTLLDKTRPRSCGCLNHEMHPNNKKALLKVNTTHGKSKTKEYRTYSGMKERCYNPNISSYPIYGGRGIRVCDRWLESFSNFLEDVGKAPSPDHSLDRYPDVNGNYEPSNVRWATAKQQANNRRNSKSKA